MREWLSQARCASDEVNVDPKDFQVPLRGDSQNKAKLVCYECPVQPQCLRWALEHREIWGVWGGLDEAELRRHLSVDSVGNYVKRCRPPGCPNPRCRARSAALKVDGSVIRCEVCNFQWKSSTSAAAIQSFIKSEKRRFQLRARISKRRIPLKVVSVLPVKNLGPRSMPLTDAPISLAASAHPET